MAYRDAGAVKKKEEEEEKRAFPKKRISVMQTSKTNNTNHSKVEDV